MWLWKRQWRLDAWPNRLISVALFLWSLALTVRLGHSPVAMVRPKADAVFVAVLRKWRGQLAQRFERPPS